MKKAIFVVVIAVLFVVVMIATPAEQLSYNFPLDEGSNKLAAATMALVASIWGAVVNIKKSLFIWGGMVVLMAVMAKFGIMCFGTGTILTSVIMCGIVGVWANNDEEIKNFLLTPFKEEKDK